MALHRLATLPTALLALLLTATPIAAQTYVSGTFVAAVWAQGGQNLQSAAQAVCPAGYPLSCSAIGEPDYCCPSNNVCAYASNQAVGCCPQGQTCSGSIGGAGGYQPSSWYQPQPTSTYYPPQQTTTVYGGGGVVVAATTVYSQPVAQTTVTQQYLGNYCTTITANGPNLPTTAGAACGVALVVAPSDASRILVGGLRWMSFFLGLYALGAVFLRGRW